MAALSNVGSPEVTSRARARCTLNHATDMLQTHVNSECNRSSLIGQFVFPCQHGGRCTVDTTEFTANARVGDVYAEPPPGRYATYP
eukprot:9472788-Pyramimonas_sp.AAC.1